MDVSEYTVNLLKDARLAARSIAVAGTLAKNSALEAIAEGLILNKSLIIGENRKDLEAAEGMNLSASVIDRLTLTEARIDDMATGVCTIASLADPVGEVLGGTVRPNGLKIEKVRVPLGVVAIIFESRPNVTADAAALCLKTGNSAILRGGKESIYSNVAIYRVIADAIEKSGLDKRCVQVMEMSDKKAVEILLKADDYVDVVIPRGGEALIRAVSENSTIPVIKHYKGICHTYVDEFANLSMAREICINAKVDRPATCNAMETMLVHKDVAKDFLYGTIPELQRLGVTIKGCEETLKIVSGYKIDNSDVKLNEVGVATEEDWNTEYLDLILSVKVVKSIEDAIDHIAMYGSGHSDAIVTESYGNSVKFTNEVDSAATYVNASTRFTDGGEFGMGAEIGISTDKLHARGPMGLPELTSYKYVVTGNGQIR